MSLLGLLLAASTVLAGHWLPEAKMKLDPDTPWLMEQPSNSRRLLQLDPPETSIEAWAGGMRVRLTDGPNDSLLLPSSPTGRVVEIRVGGPVKLNWWRESSQGDSAAWSRYVSELALWAREGGELPPAPDAIPSLEVEWAARRNAMVSVGELDPALLVRGALIDLDAIRRQSTGSHAVRVEEAIVLTAGAPGVVEVRGPGRVTLRTRASMDASRYRRYTILAALEGQPLRAHRLFSTEDEENLPGWGWPRSVSVAVPPGESRVHYQLEPSDTPDVQILVEASIERRRPSFANVRATFPRMAELDEEWKALGPVGQLETAHLMGSAEVVALASGLLGGGAADLARARLIQHLPEPSEAQQLYESSPATPLAALAFARRWIERRDVEPAILLQAAELLPTDPQLLAELADGVPWGFLRPRGRAIRMLAGLEEPSVDDTRWTQLAPARDKVRQRVLGVGGGIQRVGVRPGIPAEVLLPEPAREGRFPVLRMEASETTAYRVDGLLRRGRGQLDEALAPGMHTVSVDTGQLFLLDANLAVGGEPYRDKAAGPVPNRWALPDPGAPGEIEVQAWGKPGSLFLSTDDGGIWELRLPQLETEPNTVKAAFRIGSAASYLSVEGAPGTLVSVALRRNNVEDEPELPSPWPDPLETLAQASRAMVATRDPRLLASYRLQRAVGFGALGLVSSAHREARAVAAMPEATKGQRAQGKAIYRNTTPPVHTAEVPGPATVDAALAWAEREPVEVHTCDDLSAVAHALAPPVSWPVHRAAAECRLTEGDALSAWSEASNAGAVGRVARLRAAASGDWVLVSRVDRDAGTRRIQVTRRGPDEGDGLFAIVRELSLGAPWQPSEYSVLRKRRETTIVVEGAGELALELLCKDESFAISPQPCSLPLSIDGTTQQVEIPDSTISRRVFQLEEGEHEVRFGPLEGSRQALVARASMDGQLLPPQVGITAHLLGPRGARATVAAGSLIRVRLHGGGPALVRVGGKTYDIEDVGVIAVPGSAPAEIAIDGPPETLFTLSRLRSCFVAEEPALNLPTPLDTNTPDPDASTVTERWMHEAAKVRPDARQPIGRGGTLLAWGSAGDDATGVRDSTLHYPYFGLGAGWYQRIDGTRHWFSARGSGRFGITAEPGAHLDGTWTWAPSASILTVEGSLGGSGGAGHARARGWYRHEIPLRPSWTLEPYGGLHAGWWSGPVEVEVDPAAWSSWSAQHWAGYTLGGILDWRPLEDTRLRVVADVDSNPDFTLDRTRVELRTDAIILPMTVLRLGPELGYRFVDANRVTAYWRLVIKTGLLYSGYVRRKNRWSVQTRVDWLPLEGSIEGWLKFSWEWSHGRGLRDRAPYQHVFIEALDLPLED